jgi:hypothetical protein
MSQRTVRYRGAKGGERECARELGHAKDVGQAHWCVVVDLPGRGRQIDGLSVELSFETRCLADHGEQRHVAGVDACDVHIGSSRSVLVPPRARPMP